MARLSVPVVIGASSSLATTIVSTGYWPRSIDEGNERRRLRSSACLAGRRCR